VAYTGFPELLAAANDAGSIGLAVLALEAEEAEVTDADVRAHVAEQLGVMRDAVAAGLSGDVRSRSGMIGGDAARVTGSQMGPLGGTFAVALAGALATVEVNAAMGRIVAAPTAGSSGVLPGVLLAIAGERASSEDELIEAVLCAAGIGAVIASRATLAGATGGCQAEIGSGAAMTAAAVTQLCGGTPTQCGHAAALALQGLLGLVCDPVGGLVEVPCVHRNATGAAVALASSELALAGVEFPIPLDEVIDAMAHIGRSMPVELRETALGGLAASCTGKDLASHAGRP